MNIEVDKPWLMLGDCLERMGEIPDGSVDMILCDLPYQATACEWDSAINFPELWKHYERVIKQNGVIALTATQPFASHVISSNVKLFRYDWIWEKTHATGHLNAKKMPMRAHESVLVFYKRLPTYNPIKTSGHQRKRSYVDRSKVRDEQYGSQSGYIPYDSTERYPRSVIQLQSDKVKCNLHPTQKPVKLIEYFVKIYTNREDIVLDNCFGSGTTGVACVNTGRRFIGIELNEKYFELGQRRIEKAIFENETTALDVQPSQESLIHAR